MDTDALPAKPTSRLYFADHLRAALVILVVVHHISLMYSAAGAFYYIEPPPPAVFPNGVLRLLLSIFVLFNQAFFMGALFLIAGYFTPGSFERKGPGPYLKDRLIRLGLPTLAFIFILSPIAMIGLYVMPSSLTGITGPFTYRPGIGPLWFVEILIYFSIGYVAWRLIARRLSAKVPSPSAAVDLAFPRFWIIAAFVIALALASYLMRMVVPIGTTVPYVDFPTLSYLPQYLSFFVLGIVAYRRGWFGLVPDSAGKWGFIAAGVATVVLLPIALIGGGVGFEGRGNWHSLLYALWDSTVAVGMFLGLITLFRRKYNLKTRLGTFLSQQSFAVYVVHSPVIVLLAIALRDVHPNFFLKFLLVALIGVPLCFAVAYLIRRIPGVARAV